MCSYCDTPESTPCAKARHVMYKSLRSVCFFAQFILLSNSQNHMLYSAL